jgi:large subunit ribosomal protein L13
MKEVTIDAKGRKLGVIASEVASILRGKDRADFVPNRLPDVKVTITNASKVALDPRELKEEYIRYSEYPGGQKSETRKHLIDRLGYTPVFERAIRGMLPENRLRDSALRRLTIIE